MDHHFIIVGAMCHDRKDIPKEMKSLQGRKKDMMILSYIDKKKSTKKNIFVLTTMHDKVKVNNDQRSKPLVIAMYDHNKRGVGVVDLISYHYSTRIKSKH